MVIRALIYSVNDDIDLYLGDAAFGGKGKRSCKVREVGRSCAEGVLRYESFERNLAHGRIMSCK